MSEYGFEWGPLEVRRVAHIEGRAYVLVVDTGFELLEIYVSEKGRKIRAFKDNVELTKRDDLLEEILEHGSEDVIDFGWWCEYEGMYFDDLREHQHDENGVNRGHFDMPCGDGGWDHTGKVEKGFVRPTTTQVAIVPISEPMEWKEIPGNA